MNALEPSPLGDTRPIGSPLIEMRHIILRFCGVEAIRGISFRECTCRDMPGRSAR